MSRPSDSAYVGALYAAACVLVFAACGDETKTRKIGMTCEATVDCVEGICGGGVCIDPTGDDDGDQLTNEFEVGLGTNPINADTDNDGAGDKEELNNLSLVDIDGDTIPDALESRTADADGDCLPDQYDPQNHVSNDDLTGLIPIECRVTGVCSDIKNLRVLCDRGRGAQSATCDYSNVPSFEATEAACDGLDNDCDGVTDDGASDLDGDAIADCVDPDDDGDDHADADDDCPLIADPDQIDSDGDALGDVCDPPRPPVVGGIAPASPSNDTTPTLTGLADANALVSVFADTECATQLATVTADASGQFTASVTVTGEGLHRHYLRAENAATLRSACLPSGLPYVLDTIAPAPPLFTKATPPSPSTDPTPFIEGTAEAGALVTLALGDETFTATADASGKWAATVAIDAPGDWPFSGTATDAAGNVSTLVSLFAYSLRSDAPAPPYLSGNPFSPPSPSNVPNPRIAVTLCAPAGIRVAFWSGGCGAELLGEVDAVSDTPCPTGTGVVVTLADVGLPADATTTIFAQSIGVGELVSACVPVGAYVDDTVAPAAPALVAADPTGPFAVGLAHMLLTVAPDSNVRIFADACNSGSPLLTTWTGPNATLDVRFAVPKNASTATFGQATDLAGNTSACAPLATFVHDDHAPMTPTPHVPAFIPGSPSRLSAHPQVTWCQGPDDACSVSVQGELVSLPINGSLPHTDATCPAGYAASATVDVSENRATPFVVTCRTPAGMASPSVYVGTFIHDAIAPPTPSLISSDPASPSAERAIRMVAATENGARVEVATDADCLGLVVAAGTAGPDGHVTLAFDAPPQVTTTFYAKATDAAGNPSACGSLLTFLHDDRVPGTPSVAPTPWAPASPSGQTTAPVLQVCVQPDLATELFTGFGCAGPALALPPAGTDATCATGASAAAPVPVLGNAVTRVFGQTVGPTGVRSACVFLAEYTHDDHRPADPVITGINPQSPASERDVQVTFTTTAGDAGALYTDASCLGATLCNGVDGDRNGSIALHCVMPPNATTPLFARASDLAGNLSACVGAGAFTHDDAIPEAPIRRAVAFAPTSPSSASADPTLFVCTRNPYALQVFSGPGCTGVPFALGAPTQDATCASGVSASGPVNVVHNAKTLFFARHLSATNVASACILIDGFVHDDTPPADPAFLSLQPGSPSAQADVRLTLSVEEGAAIAVYTAADCGGAALAQDDVLGGGAATLAFTAPRNTTTTFYARATDGAGNASGCVNLATFTHDDQVPAPPTAHPAPFSPTSPSSASTTPSVRACAGGTATIEAYAGLGCSGPVTLATPAADASCPSPGLGVAPTMNATSNGKTRYFARAIGPTGVASSCEYVGEYIHDALVPAAPVLTSIDPPSPSGTRTPALKGTGEIGAKLVLSTSSTCATVGATQIVGASGQWTIPFTVAANAQTAIYGQLSDAAGNASACTLLATYTHDNLAPASPRLLTAPRTPNNDSSPAVPGCAENAARVDLYTNKDCAGVAAHSDVADVSDAACSAGERRFDGDVPVPANSASQIWALAIDAAGNRSNCVMLTAYTHDNVAPAAPVGFEERWDSHTTTEVTLKARALVEPKGRLRVKRLVAGTPTCAGATQLVESVADADGKVKTQFTVPSNTTVQVFVEPLDEALNRGACAGPFTVVGTMTVRTELNDAGHTLAPGQKIMLQDPSGNLVQTTTMTANGGNDVSFLVFDGFMVTVAWMQPYTYYPDYQGGLVTYQAYQLQTYTTARPGDAVTLRQPLLKSQPESQSVGDLTVNITAFDPPNAVDEAYYVFMPGCHYGSYVFNQGTSLTTTPVFMNQAGDCGVVVGQNYEAEVWVAVRPASLGQGAVGPATAYAHGTFTWPVAGCGGLPCGEIDLGAATHPWSTVFTTSTLTIANGGVTFLPIIANLDEFVETSYGDESLDYHTFGGNSGGGGGPFGSGETMLLDAAESAHIEYAIIPGIGSGSRLFAGKTYMNVAQGAQSMSMYVAQRVGPPPSAGTIDLATLLPLVYLANENDTTNADRPLYTMTTDGESIEGADFASGLFTWRDDTALEFLEWRLSGRPRDLTTLRLPVTDANPCPLGAANCNPAVAGGGPNNRFKPSFFGTGQSSGGLSWFDMDAVPGSVEPGAAMAGFADAWTYFGTNLFELSLFQDNSQIDAILPATFTGRVTAIGGGGGSQSIKGGGATTGP